MKKVEKLHSKNNIYKYQTLPGIELPDGLYSATDIQDYFDDIIKKHDTFTVNPPIRIYVIKIGKRTTFRINTGYYLKLL